MRLELLAFLGSRGGIRELQQGAFIVQKGIRVIVDLKEISHFGVWEMGLLTSFKKEVDQRAGILRLCSLSPCLQGYFQNDRFAEQFEIYRDLECAMEGERN